MKASLAQWFRSHNVMLANAGSLVGTSAVTSGLGFVYWGVVAREFPAEAIGLGSATISAMTLLGTFCMLGLGTLLMGELSRQPGKEISLVSTALLVVFVVGGCSGIAFALVAPFLSVSFQPLRVNIANILLFAVGVGLTASVLVLDQALIGLLRGNLQLWRNTFFSIIKLVAILVVVLGLFHKAGLTIYMTWTIANALSLVILGGFWLWRGGRFKATHQPQWKWLRKLGGSALQHHIINLTLVAPTLILPVLVTIMLSAQTNAWFYVAGMLGSFIAIVPIALTAVLYATSSAQPEILTKKIRLTLGLSMIAILLANVVILFGSRQILSIFGHEYVQQATLSLQMQALSIFPGAIKDHFVAVSRIQGRMHSIMIPIIIGSLFELSAAALGAHLGGLAGLNFGWFIAMCIEAGFMFRTVCKAVWPTTKSITGNPLIVLSQSIPNRKQ